MTPESIATLQLVLSGLNVLAIPALVGVMRWLMRVELRLAHLEWASGKRPEKGTA